MFRTLCTVSLLCLLGPALAAADIYVATTGNNANPGTMGSPKLTLAAALTAAVAGDTIILRAGTYAGDVEIDKQNITLQSHTGEWATVSVGNGASDPFQCIWITASGSTIRRLEIVGGSYYCLKYEGIDNHVVEDCRVHDSGRDCFKIVPDTDNVTIRRCEIYNSGQRDPSNAEGIDNVNGDNMHVIDCYIHDIATNGVYPKGGAKNAVIERCLITDCGSGGVFLGFQTDSVFMNVPAGDNPSYYESINGTVRNCIIANTFYAGIGFCSAQNAKVYNNTLYNVATGGMSALHFHPRDGDNGINPACTGLDIRNNIVIQVSGTRALMQVRTGSGGYNTLASGGLTMNNNYYYRSGGAISFRNDQTGATSQTLAQWRAAMGTDAQSIEGDPSINTTTFHLNGSSPCIDAGAAIASIVDDFDGNARSGSLDIGADESGGTALTVPPGSTTIGTGGNGLPGSGGGGSQAPAITSSAPTLATVGVLYTYTIATTGNPAPTLSVAGNPGWLTLSGNTLSGTPTVDGTTGTITITAGNGTAPDALQSFSITISPAGGGGGGGGGGGTGGTGTTGTSGGGGGGCSAQGSAALALMPLLSLLALRRRRLKR